MFMIFIAGLAFVIACVFIGTKRVLGLIGIVMIGCVAWGLWFVFVSDYNNMPAAQYQQKYHR